MNKKECWICILELKDKENEKIPDGFDLPLRRAIDSILDSKGIEYENMYSGWGCTREKANKLLDLWAREE